MRYAVAMRGFMLLFSFSSLLMASVSSHHHHPRDHSFNTWKSQKPVHGKSKQSCPRTMPAAKRLCHHRNAKQPQPCYSGSLELHCSRELSRVETSANEPSNSKSVDFLAFRRNRWCLAVWQMFAIGATCYALSALDCCQGMVWSRKCHGVNVDIHMWRTAWKTARADRCILFHRFEWWQSVVSGQARCRKTGICYNCSIDCVHIKYSDSEVWWRTKRM